MHAQVAAPSATNTGAAQTSTGNGSKCNARARNFKRWCANEPLVAALAEARTETAYVRIMVSAIEDLLSPEAISRFGDALELIDGALEWAEHDVRVPEPTT